MDFANYEEQKILLALYCINKSKVHSDCTMECNSGQCLCLDEEQLALLDQLLGTQIKCEVENGKAGFFKTQDYNKAIPFCFKNQAASKKLIQNLNMTSVEIQSAIATTTGKIEEEVWQEVLCGLPLLQMINIRSKLTCRDTIAYWCLFGENSEEFLGKVLKAFCVCAIYRSFKGQDVKCVADYMDSVFGKISELYVMNEFEESCRRFRQSIEQYEEKFREEKTSLRVGCHSLRELYRNISGLQFKRADNPEAITYILGNNESSMNEILQLYRLVKKVFAVFGTTLGKATEDFWNVKIKNETPHFAYLRFMEVLEHISSKDASTKMRIWQQFVLLITDAMECSSENVEAFYKEYL